MSLQLEPMQPEGRDGSVFNEEKNFLKTQLENYVPWNEQEEKDRRIMLFSLNTPGIFTRENLLAHFTASAWICNKDRRKVLMAYHKIYDSWAWTGGHADGQRDLLSVAIREAGEETGVCAAPLSRDIFSLEILTVDGHEKRGSYVPSHLHLMLLICWRRMKNKTSASKRMRMQGLPGLNWRKRLKNARNPGWCSAFTES